MAYYKNNKTGKTYTSSKAASRAGGSVSQVSSAQKSSGGTYSGSKLSGSYYRTGSGSGRSNAAPDTTQQGQVNEILSRQAAAGNTKAAARLANQASQGHAGTYIAPDVGSKGKTTSTAPQQQTAWNKISDIYNEDEKFSSWYTKMDYGFGGFLPGGLSRSLVKAADTEIKVQDTAILSAAQEDLNKAKVIKDYSKKSWYESLGFGFPEEERQYQEQQGIIRETNILREISQGVGSGAAGTYLNDQEGKSPIGLSTYALMGAAILIGVMVMKK